MKSNGRSALKRARVREFGGGSSYGHFRWLFAAAAVCAVLSWQAKQSAALICTNCASCGDPLNGSAFGNATSLCSARYCMTLYTLNSTTYDIMDAGRSCDDSGSGAGAACVDVTTDQNLLRGIVTVACYCSNDSCNSGPLLLVSGVSSFFPPSPPSPTSNATLLPPTLPPSSPIMPGPGKNEALENNGSLTKVAAIIALHFVFTLVILC